MARPVRRLKSAAEYHQGLDKFSSVSSGQTRINESMLELGSSATTGVEAGRDSFGLAEAPVE